MGRVAKQAEEDTPSLETLHALECSACPLNNADVRHPKMAATGTAEPVVYILGEAPGAEEDFKATQFVGRSGQILREIIPKSWSSRIRWNNVVRTRPTSGRGNRTPTPIEIECCRPSVTRDIAQSRPTAIFGFGGIPLEWLGLTGIMAWRGRRLPVNIGGHVCWYYPIVHPAFILRAREFSYNGKEDERTFEFDVKRAFEEVEKGLPVPQVHTAETARQGVRWLFGGTEADCAEICKFLSLAETEPAVGIDYETNMLRPYSDSSKILTIAISNGDQTLAFPYDHKDCSWTKPQRHRIAEAWEELLLSKAIKIAHNATFEQEWSAEFFGEATIRHSRWACTMALAYTLDERKLGKPGTLSLDFLTTQYYGLPLKSLTPDLDLKNMAEEPLSKILPYNGMDAKYSYLLYTPQAERLGRLQRVYAMQARRISACVFMQRKGLHVNQADAQKLFTKYDQRLKDIDAEIMDLPIAKRYNAIRKERDPKDEGFNPGSNQQLVEIFRDILKIHTKETDSVATKSEPFKYTVDEEALSSIDHPLAELAEQRRKAVKQKSTYIEPLIANSKRSIIYSDGQLHPSFNTCFTVTGRLSSSDPNAQNFPKRDSEGKEARRPIIAPKGYMMAAFDYGQIEARVIAMASKDKLLVKSMWEGYDIHMEWTERLIKAYPSVLDRFTAYPNAKKAFRTDVKNQWTFPLFYGASLASASGYLNMPETVIKPLYNMFWKQFDGVKAWQERELRHYYRYGYVIGLTGRYRRAPLSLNMVINNPIQGVASDIVVDAMCRLSERNDWDVQPILNVHDDLTFLFDETKLEAQAEIVISEMLKLPYEFVNVPITVELAIGKNWADLHEVATYASNEWFD